MSRSRLPQEPLGQPPKVVFEGVQEGSQEAEDLYAQYSGQIAQFHVKARQAAQLADLGQYRENGRLADDAGIMHYTRNSGQETLRIKLNNEIVVTAPQPPPPLPEPPDVPRYLAIDVISKCRPFLQQQLDVTNYGIVDGELFAYSTGQVNGYLVDGAMVVGLELQRGDEEPLFAESSAIYDGAGNYIVGRDGLTIKDPISNTLTAINEPWAVQLGDAPRPPTSLGQEALNQLLYAFGDVNAAPAPRIPYGGDVDGGMIWSFIAPINDLTKPLKLKLYATGASYEGRGTVDQVLGFVWDPQSTTVATNTLRSNVFRIRVREMLGRPAAAYLDASMIGQTAPTGDVGGSNPIFFEPHYAVVPVLKDYAGDLPDPTAAGTEKIGDVLAETGYVEKMLTPNVGGSYTVTQITHPDGSTTLIPPEPRDAPTQLLSFVIWQDPGTADRMTHIADLEYTPGDPVAPGVARPKGARGRATIEMIA